jgi:hypothetical protein
VYRYDGLGRKIAEIRYDHEGRRTGMTAYRYSAKRLEVYQSTFEDHHETIEFDDYGRPTYGQDYFGRYAIETNADGLPIQHTVVESFHEYVEVGFESNFVDYEGDGCSVIAGSEWTNGPVR